MSKEGLIAHQLAGNRVGYDHIFGDDDGIIVQRSCRERAYPSAAYGPVDYNQIGVKAEFTSRMACSMLFLWSLALSMSENVPYIFFMPRVTPVRR